MSDAAFGAAADRVLRPYPLRGRVRRNWLDRVLRRAFAEAALLARPRRLGRRAFIAAVERAARAEEARSDAALRARAAELRAALAREGLTETGLVAAFGLARAAATRELGLRHRPVQVYGARLLIEGRMLEMATGEGKSATALLAAAAAALAGVRPHVVTVNDYLAGRDHAAFAHVLERLGLTAGLVIGGMAPAERRRAYRADVVYVNNKEIAFDYLKDSLAMGPARAAPRARLRAAYGDPDREGPAAPLLLDGLRFAIIDEADGVLVDEAGTPLIISAGGGAPPAPEPYLEALDLARRLEPGRHWTVVPHERRVRLTEAGIAALAARAARLGGLWAVSQAREERARQALAALHLHARDAQYIVAETESGPAIQIVDEFTGRVMPDRAWEGGLHQMIEAKEGVPPTPPRRTVARITYQRFFGQYLRLSGMTGTGMEIAAEMHAVFDLPTTPAPPHRPSRRRFLGVTMAPSGAEKRARVAARARALAAEGRAVLIGSRSVAASEALSEALAAAGVAHRVLNARQDADEAAVVAEAGRPGRVTIATNMAGRGTDIVLDPEVEARGGLHVILTEHHESRRIDRQLHGRAGRQGDRGSAEEIVALDDELYARHAPRLVRIVGALPGGARSPFCARLLRGVMQARAERDAAARRRLELRRDVETERAMAFAGREHG